MQSAALNCLHHSGDREPIGVAILPMVGDDASVIFIALEVSILFMYSTSLLRTDSGNRAGATVVVVLSDGACSNECG